jgi:hypothetical protein
MAFKAEYGVTPIDWIKENLWGRAAITDKLNQKISSSPAHTLFINYFSFH